MKASPEHSGDIVAVLLAILGTVATFLTPIAGLLILMVCFILLDTGMGIYATIKLNGIKSFKSNKLFNLVVKSFFYLFTIIMAFTADKFLVENTVILGIPNFLAKTMCVTWCYIEIKSLDETSIKLGNRSFWVIFKEMVDKLKSIKKDLEE